MSESRKRPGLIAMRVNMQEKAIIEEFSRELGISTGEFLRRAAYLFYESETGESLRAACARRAKEQND